jgi:hypothetical protein
VEVEPLVSDHDREQIVGRLRLAHAEGYLDLDEFGDRAGRAYGARTRAELAEVVDGLPEPPPPPATPAAGLATTRWIVGVLSGNRRRGRWRPDPTVRAVAVLGSVVVDLTEVDLDPTGRGAPDELVVVAVAVFGGVEVLVPEGVAVDLGGFAVLGGKDARVPAGGSAHAAGPVVRVRARAVLGGVTVRSHRFRRGFPGALPSGGAA